MWNRSIEELRYMYDVPAVVATVMYADCLLDFDVVVVVVVVVEWEYCRAIRYTYVTPAVVAVVVVYAGCAAAYTGKSDKSPPELPTNLPVQHRVIHKSPITDTAPAHADSSLEPHGHQY